MKIEGNTHHKCIHEALDYSWCDCSDQTREELQVTLPRPGAWCDGCDETEADYVMHMTDSVSMDNVFFGCRQCAADVLQDWMYTDLYGDTEGWEIKKL